MRVVIYRPEVPGRGGNGVKDIVCETTPTGCWEVVSHSVEGSGYVRIGCNRKLTRAHRLVYEMLVGEIPSGQCILHSCDNRRCVNPAHLRVGTQTDNIRDAVERGRTAGGERSGKAKLTTEDVRDIRKDTRIHREIAQSYGVCRSTISFIKRGATWRSGQ